MGNKTYTLLERLSEIVDEVHINEVKEIIVTLTKINDFKHNIENDLCEQEVFERITYELETEFKISEFSITVIYNGIEKNLFKTENFLKHSFEYTNTISNDTTFNILVQADHLDNYKEIVLNSYFNELTPLLYIQLVLNNLQKSATIDPLTNLHNRISFNQEIKTLAPLALREKMNLGVLLINIDRFRAVNDEHGDEFGDQFLKLYADTIVENIRSSDIAVRFSGGEFLVLLINVDSQERTMMLAEKIKNKLAETYLLSPNGDQFKKTVCVGVSVFPEDSDDINQVIKNAEMALSDAQDIDRNIVKRFEKKDESTIDFF